MNQRLIVTEGERDAAFVGQLLSKFGIRRVKALPPSKAAAVGGDGWPNALSATRLTLMQMADGAVESLAIIVDADYAHSNGRGYRTVFAEYSSLLSEFGYANPTRVGDGLVFRSNDGLRPAGLWILPDTGSDGMLEHFLFGCVADGVQQTLLREACEAVGKVSTVLFSRDLHLKKAEIATWLAWQKMPGKHLASTVSDELLNFESPALVNTKRWLEAIFKVTD